MGIKPPPISANPTLLTLHIADTHNVEALATVTIVVGWVEAVAPAVDLALPAAILVRARAIDAVGPDAALGSESTANALLVGIWDSRRCSKLHSFCYH